MRAKCSAPGSTADGFEEDACSARARAPEPSMLKQHSTPTILLILSGIACGPSPGSSHGSDSTGTLDSRGTNGGTLDTSTGETAVHVSSTGCGSSSTTDDCIVPQDYEYNGTCDHPCWGSCMAGSLPMCVVFDETEYTTCSPFCVEDEDCGPGVEGAADPVCMTIRCVIPCDEQSCPRGYACVPAIEDPWLVCLPA